MNLFQLDELITELEKQNEEKLVKYYNKKRFILVEKIKEEVFNRISQL